MGRNHARREAPVYGLSGVRSAVNTVLRMGTLRLGSRSNLPPGKQWKSAASGPSGPATEPPASGLASLEAGSA